MKTQETPLLDALLGEVQAFCKDRRGRVSELAEALGVQQPQLSAWLTRKRQPGGEIALQLQRWLAEARARELAEKEAEDLKRRGLVQGLRGGGQ